MPKKRAQRLEADVKDDVKDALDAHGWFWWVAAASKFSKSGIADIMAVRHGMFIAIETKPPEPVKPEPTPNQIAFLQDIKRMNHFAFVVNRSRFEYFVAFLDALERAQAAPVVKGVKMVKPEDGAMMINAIREMQLEI